MEECSTYKIVKTLRKKKESGSGKQLLTFSLQVQQGTVSTIKALFKGRGICSILHFLMGLTLGHQNREK